MRRLIVVLLLLLVPAPAEGAVTLKKGMWGPATRDGQSQFPIYQDLGVGVWETPMRWDAVAPTRPADPANPQDPAYVWPAELDAAVADAAARGITVSILLLGAPGWANGGQDWRWLPTRAQDFADFAAAVSRRYPGVHRWMIWGEPTKAQNTQPITPDKGRPLHGRNLRTAQHYADMLDRSYVALKAVSRKNLVIGGNTFTTGTITTLHWIKALRLRNGRRPRMDLYGHNPFSLREPDLSRPPTGGGYADFDDLDTLVRWLDHYFPHRRLKLFLSEYSLPTDHPNYEFNFFLTRGAQAQWLGEALEIVRGWSRIATLGYLGLYDDALTSAGDQVERGLITREGERKPAYDQFKGG